MFINVAMGKTEKRGMKAGSGERKLLRWILHRARLNRRRILFWRGLSDVEIKKIRSIKRN